ncbi:MAG TPA: hypothetical protein VNM92_05105 [Thermoanaerobaculia bacterium]|nr:hypothetical protein [Thermoanaerobaculia bacterium]
MFTPARLLTIALVVVLAQPIYAQQPLATGDVVVNIGSTVAKRGRVVARAQLKTGILLPVSYDPRDILGTEIHIRNRGLTPLEISGAPCFVSACSRIIRLRPLETRVGPVVTFHSVVGLPGTLIFTSTPEQLSFSLRLFDPLKPEAMGTDVPVIRESEMLRGKTDLLGVSVSERLQVTLRIYGGKVGSRFVVRIFDDAETLRKVMTATTGATVTDGEHIIRPSSVQIDQLETLPELAGLNRVRIEVEPEDPEGKFWTFVTVWNKQTGQIMTVTPQ